MKFLGNAPTSITTGVPGWETPDEEAVLMTFASELKGKPVIVEIGGEFGRSASQFAAANKNAKIFTVDLFPADHHFAVLHGGLLNVFLHNTLTWASQINPIQSDSTEASKTWNKKIDLLFVDGDHSYGGCKRDLENWYKHVKPGGLIVVHDYAKDEYAHFLHQEVKRATDEFCEKNELQLNDTSGSLVYFDKPKRVRKSRK